MCQLARFQINEDEALEDVVVEDQVNEEIPGLGADALLPGDEGEAFAQFQHECLEFVDDGLFEGGFAEFVRIRNAEKLQDVRVFDEILGRWSERSGFRLHFLDDRRMIAAQQQAFVVQRVDWPLQGADSPVLVDGFPLVPGPGTRLFHSHQEPIARPGQLVTLCVTNSGCRLRRERQMKMAEYLRFVSVKPFPKSWVRRTDRLLSNAAPYFARSNTSQRRLVKMSGRMNSLYFGASLAPRIEQAASQICREVFKVSRRPV